MPPTKKPKTNRAASIAERVYDNYVNGNLTDAKHIAKRVSFENLMEWLRQNGKTPEEAYAVTGYLKGKGSFRAAADAELNAKGKL